MSNSFFHWISGSWDCFISGLKINATVMTDFSYRKGQNSNLRAVSFQVPKEAVSQLVYTALISHWHRKEWSLSHPLLQVSISSPVCFPTSISSLGPVFGRWIRGLTWSLRMERLALLREERETCPLGSCLGGFPPRSPATVPASQLSWSVAPGGAGDVWSASSQVSSWAGPGRRESQQRWLFSLPLCI